MIKGTNIYTNVYASPYTSNASIVVGHPIRGQVSMYDLDAAMFYNISVQELAVSEIYREVEECDYDCVDEIISEDLRADAESVRDEVAEKMGW